MTYISDYERLPTVLISRSNEWVNDKAVGRWYEGGKWDDKARMGAGAVVRASMWSIKITNWALPRGSELDKDKGGYSRTRTGAFSRHNSRVCDVGLKNQLNVNSILSELWDGEINLNSHRKHACNWPFLSIHRVKIWLILSTRIFRSRSCLGMCENARAISKDMRPKQRCNSPNSSLIRGVASIKLGGETS